MADLPEHSEEGDPGRPRGVRASEKAPAKAEAGAVDRGARSDARGACGATNAQEADADADPQGSGVARLRGRLRFNPSARGGVAPLAALERLIRPESQPAAQIEEVKNPYDRPLTVHSRP